jgi:hypothetical protein
MAGAKKLSAEEINRLLEGERRDLVAALRKIAKREHAARLRDTDRRIRFEERAMKLLLDGKSLGVSVVEMADELGITRQMAHRLIRDAEGSGR